MRLIDLDDSAHNHMCYNGEYEVWSIDTEKTVDAEPVRHGSWLCVDDFDDLDGYGMCSECMYNSFEPIDYVRDEWKYCPRCGAKMDGKEEE